MFVSVSVVLCCEVVGSSARRQPTITEMSKLEAEINFLKRSLAVSEPNVSGQYSCTYLIRNSFVTFAFTLCKLK